MDNESDEDDFASTATHSEPAPEVVEEAVASVPRPRASAPILVLGSLAVIGVLYFARDLIIPLAFALLLALLLRPLFRRMQKTGLPDLLSAFLLVAAVAVVFSIGMIRLAGQAQEWLSHAPDTVSRVSRMLPSRSGPIGDLQKTTDAVKDLGKPDGAEKPTPVEVQPDLDLAYTLLGVSGHLLASAVIVFVVAFFVLGLSDTLLKQAVESRSRFHEKRNIVQLVQNVETGISRYLLTVTLINVGLGIVTALAMWMLGLPNPVLWGVLATTLNYVPHVGAFICMVVLFFVGAVSHESLAYGGLVAGCFAVITFVESYFVTPMTLSKSLQLSPLAVILSILFWGWLWGISGGLMAAPLLAIAKIICDQFESTRTLGAILGEAPSKSAASPLPTTHAPAKQAA